MTTAKMMRYTETDNISATSLSQTPDSATVDDEFKITSPVSAIEALPEEISSKIVGYVFYHEEGAVSTQVSRQLAKRVRRSFPSLDRPPPQLSLLLVNKNFYFTGIEAFFGSNALYFHGFQRLATNLRRIGNDRKRYISQLIVTLEFEFLDSHSTQFFDFITRGPEKFKPKYMTRYCLNDAELILSTDLPALLPRLEKIKVQVLTGYANGHLPNCFHGDRAIANIKTFVQFAWTRKVDCEVDLSGMGWKVWETV